MDWRFIYFWAMSTENFTAAIIATGRMLYDHFLVTASEGNLSLREPSGRIHITVAGSCLGRLNDSDVVLIDDKGRQMAGEKKASSEYRLHLTVYKGRPDIMAVCHAHPPHATAFGVVDCGFPKPFLPEAVLFVGEVPLVDYATPGSEELAGNLERYLERHNAFILKNHGVLTLGQNIAEAFGRMEMIENLARIAYIASALGEIKPLGEDEIRRLEKIGKSFSSDRSADD